MLDNVQLKPHNVKIFNEAMDNIKNYGKTAIVEPTGCGKSYVLMQLMREFQDGKVILIGPSKSLFANMRKSKYWIPSTVCHTYSFLNRTDIKKSFGEIGKVSLIAMDEMHRAGAKKWGAAAKELINLFPDAAFVGLTATPIRHLDENRDMVDELFDGIVAGNLSFEDAIELGILPKPTYITGFYSTEGDIELRLRKASRLPLFKDKAIALVRKMEDLWASELIVGKMMKKYLNPNGDAIGGSKHLVFADSIGTATDLEPSVKRWFEHVFPDLKVNVYLAHSKKANHKAEVTKFCEDSNQKEVDVLISVNMVNEGFHIDNTACIVMLRKTGSPTIFTQQLGRALASGGASPFIFDLVGNYDAMIREKEEGMIGKRSKRMKMNRAKLFEFPVNFVDPSDIVDEAKEYSKLILTIDGLLANNFEESVEALKEALKEVHSISDLPISKREGAELKKWGLHVQRMYFKGRLSHNKSLLFGTIGNKIYATPECDNLGEDWLEVVQRLANDPITSLDSSDGKWLTTARRRFTEGNLQMPVRKAMEVHGIPVRYSDEWLSSVLNRYAPEFMQDVKWLDGTELTLRNLMEASVYVSDSLNSDINTKCFKKEYFKRWKIAKGLGGNDFLTWAGHIYGMSRATSENRIGGVNEEIFVNEFMCAIDPSEDMLELQRICGVDTTEKQLQYVMDKTLWGKYLGELKEAFMTKGSVGLIECINVYSAYNSISSPLHETLKQGLDFDTALLIRDIAKVDELVDRDETELSDDAKDWIVQELYGALMGTERCIKLIDMLVQRLNLTEDKIFGMSIVDVSTLDIFNSAAKGDPGAKMELETLIADGSNYLQAVTMALNTKYANVIIAILN